MKTWWHTYRSVVGAFIFWRVGLEFIAHSLPFRWVTRQTFLGPYTLWANFDGVHYVTIAESGYHIYQYAFFPLYPIFIRLISYLTKLPTPVNALLISHGSFLYGLILFYTLSKQGNKNGGAWWSVVFLLAFPTSFFFASVYTESFFFLLSLLAISSIREHKWFRGGLFGLLASATRVTGILLLIPFVAEYLSQMKKNRSLSSKGALVMVVLGIGMYMSYLWLTIGDPLAFLHVLPAFGTGRSVRELILIPQVIYRYMKIFVSVDPSLFIYHISLFEFISFFGASIVLGYGWKTQKSLRPLILYAFVSLLVPTFTGTLTSMPRYILSAFPIFIILGHIPSIPIKVVLVTIFGLALVYFCSAFLRGYFVS